VVFERNLARLARRNPLLAERIAKAEPGPVAIERGPTGATTLVESGLRLASAYDPAAEGRRLAAGVLAEKPDLLVAIGLGSGHQIDAFRAERRAPVVAYEPSLARWRALLAARDDIGWLDADDVDCASEIDEFVGHFRGRYAAGLAVRTCVQPVVERLEPARVREGLDRLAHAKRAADSTSFTRISMMQTWSDLVVENAPHLLATPSLSRLFGAFAGVPAVVVAAGPSLDRQLPALARESERLLVIAIGQTQRALARAGIRADFVHVVESKDVAHQVIGHGDPADLALVVAPSCHPRLFEAPARARFVAYPAPYRLACWLASAMGDSSFLPGGATVAQSAVHLAAALGASSIALVGQDLAFTGGRVYASNSAYDMVSFQQTGNGRYAFTGRAEMLALLNESAPTGPELTDDLVWVEGWDGAPVPTGRHYAAFIEHYRGIAAHLAARGVSLVNCTEGGARLPGVAHRPFAAWLAEQPRERVDGAERAFAAFDAAPRFEAGALSGSIAAARASLDALERAARRGLERAERATRSRGGKRAAARRIDVLRGLARATDSVRETLDELPWLDDLTQRALHEIQVAQRKVGAAAGASAAYDEAVALLRATRAAVESGRAQLARLEARLAPVQA
jgi:hypothetical protein